MYKSVPTIQELLHQSIDSTPKRVSHFFKTGPGQYAAHDKFLGIKNPTLRNIARHSQHLSLFDIKKFLISPYNEERLFALFILVLQYKKSNQTQQDAIYNFYINNINQVNNWNLIDASAHYIVGAHLYDKDRSILTELAQSTDLWERRIAIVATWYFIKKQDFILTLQLTTMLLDDKHDLIHKACGWMLREMGKQNEEALLTFLNMHAAHMPRTMLHYAIERLPEKIRKIYLTSSLQ